MGIDRISNGASRRLENTPSLLVPGSQRPTIQVVLEIIGEGNRLMLGMIENVFEGKSVVVTGGTGSLGHCVVRELFKSNVSTITRWPIFVWEETDMNWFDGAVGAVGAKAAILLWSSLAGKIDYPDPFLTAMKYLRKFLGK